MLSCEAGADQPHILSAELPPHRLGRHFPSRASAHLPLSGCLHRRLYGCSPGCDGVKY